MKYGKLRLGNKTLGSWAADSSVGAGGGADVIPSYRQLRYLLHYAHHLRTINFSSRVPYFNIIAT
jgi:hypothetical protein